MMFSRLKYPHLYCCLAKATGLRCFVASQPIIKYMHFHGQFLIQKVAARGQKIFCGALAGGQEGRRTGGQEDRRAGGQEDRRSSP